MKGKMIFVHRIIHEAFRDELAKLLDLYAQGANLFGSQRESDIRCPHCGYHYYVYKSIDDVINHSIHECLRCGAAVTVQELLGWGL